MQPPPLSLNGLFSPQQQFVVPLFQRPYVWNREKNWEPLWEDLRRVADRIAAGQPPRAHFLGQVVLQMMQTTTSMGVARREVIDGQQRLTTLQVVLRAAQDALMASGVGDLVGLIEPLTRNLVISGASPDLAFKVWPTNADRLGFRSAMTVEASADAVRHPLNDVRSFFRERFEQWLTQDSDTGARVSALVDTLQNRLLLIPIDLDANDEAQVIFETLNGRGTPLLPSDLVKNWLLRQIERERGPVEALYEAHWRAFDENQTYWRHEVGRGHAKRARVDHFLQHHLTMRTGKEATTSHLFSDFLDYVEPRSVAVSEPNEAPAPRASTSAQPPAAATVIADIAASAALFERFSPQHPDPVPARVFGWLDDLEINTLAPFLMRLFELCVSDRIARDAVLVDFESFIVRRFICRQTARSYNQVAVRLLSELGDVAAEAPARVRAALLRGTSSNDAWPDDVTVRDVLINRPLYGWHSAARVNALLRALELGVRTEYMPTVPLPPTLWVEHLMPQKWETHWPLPVDAAMVGNASGEDLAARRKRLTDTLGNLTLVTAKMNIEMPNGSWSDKRDWIRKHGLLVAMNHELLEGDPWSEERIVIRSTTLADVAVALWPHPEPHTYNPEPAVRRPPTEPLVLDQLPITDSVQIGSRRVIQYVNGSIAIEVDGTREPVVMPILREIAAELRLSPLNSNGNAMNTRQLGAAIIAMTASDNRFDR